MISQTILDAGSAYARNKAETDTTEYGVNYFKFLKGLIKRLDNHNDALIILCGERNSGKSSFALNSALILRDLGLKFDFYNDLFYDSADMEKAIGRITNSERTVFIYDEMIDLGYSQEAMTKINRINKKIFTRLRKMNNIYFFCIPYLIDLDKMFRNRLGTLWLEMVYAGKNREYHRKTFVASLHIKSNVSSVDPDPYGIEDFQKKYLNKKKVVHRSKVELFQKFKSFITFLRCHSVPKEVFVEYYQISKAGIKTSGEKIIKELKGKLKKIDDGEEDEEESM